MRPREMRFQGPFYGQGERSRASPRLEASMTWKDVAGRYGELVRRVVRTLIRDEAQALDVSQEALLKIGRALRHPEGMVEDPEAWVITVARNAARDALRRKTRRREV